MKGPTKREIDKLRRLFPPEIEVGIVRTKDGGFVAHVKLKKEPRGFATEGNTFSELVEMINDAVKTYFEIPKRFTPYMPSYIPPIRVAQKLDIFPVINKVTHNIVFPLAAREETAR